MSLNILRSRAPALTSRNTISRLALLNSHFTGTRVANRISTPPGKRTMSSLPSTMKAVVLTEAGGTDKLKYSESEPLPKLGDGQILVKNNIAGINFIDTYFRTGLYPAPNGYPMILGQEGAGTVAAVQGNSQGFKEGDRVVWIKQGGYAEYTAVAADRAIKIPSGLSDEEAVGSFLMGMTALSLVQEAYEVKKGDKVLVHAAAGGMGLLLCQILRDIGAYTIGTASTQAKCDLAKSNGASVMVNYSDNKDWASEVKKLTDGKGVDVVFDSVGKSTWEGSLDAVKRKGKGTTHQPSKSRRNFWLILGCSCLLGQRLRPNSTHEHHSPLPEERLNHAFHSDAVHRDPRRARVLRQRSIEPCQGRQAEDQDPQGIRFEGRCAGARGSRGKGNERQVVAEVLILEGLCTWYDAYNRLFIVSSLLGRGSTESAHSGASHVPRRAQKPVVFAQKHRTHSSHLRVEARRISTFSHPLPTEFNTFPLLCTAIIGTVSINDTTTVTPTKTNIFISRRTRRSCLNSSLLL
jgi:NADPH:quinone reductase